MHSHFDIAEILAMAELGCQHVTIQAPELKKLVETPDTLPPVRGQKPKHPYAKLVTPERLKVLSTTDGLAGPDWDGVLATMETDYVSDCGRRLNDFIKEDPVIANRFKDAARLFLDAETKAKGAIEHEMQALGFEL